MRATIMYAAGDVRVENVPDPTLASRQMRSCASPRLHLRQRPVAVRSMERMQRAQSMGHEAIGVVEAVGAASAR